MKKNMKKTLINAAIAAAMVAVVPGVNAATSTFNWTGNFTMLDSSGAAMNNTSAVKGSNGFQTPISGTMTFDQASGAGTGTLVPFDFFSNPASQPAEAIGINMQAIGDGAGGPGTLVLGNMLFNWSGNNGIPVSIVLDAAGFFNNELTAGGALSAAPASDGTYTNATFGYLNQGPIPIATTNFNTSFANGCVAGNCMGNGASGGLPLIVDNAPNGNRTDPAGYGNGVGIGGNPFADGPFPNDNANFDVSNMTFLSSDANRTIAQNCALDPNISCGAPTPPPAVPIPAAVWLFGSGLLGLVGVARRRKSNV